jgi:hypothetical protein
MPKRSVPRMNLGDWHFYIYASGLLIDALKNSIKQGILSHFSIGCLIKGLQVQLSLCCVECITVCILNKKSDRKSRPIFVLNY